MLEAVEADEICPSFAARLFTASPVQLLTLLKKTNLH